MHKEFLEKQIKTVFAVFLAFVFALGAVTLSGCDTGSRGDESSVASNREPYEERVSSESEEDTAQEDESVQEVTDTGSETASSETDTGVSDADVSDPQTSTGFDVSLVAAYTDSPYVTVNENVPYFTADEITEESFESYSDLDELGRCGVAFACIGTDLMPTEERGEIGQIKPSGWHTVKYAGIDGNYLYNRCHLIAFMLAGENANEKNLITGTRYLNTQGMLPFEEDVCDYVKDTGNHVMYRVTPVFEGENLVASGVLMEAYSVEDSGSGICFCIYCYNVQPGVTIDYATGESSGPEFTGSDSSSGLDSSGSTSAATSGASAGEGDSSEDDSASLPGYNEERTYILNTNTKKIHLPGCSSVSQMSESNKETYTGTLKELISMGYEPCGNCLD